MKSLLITGGTGSFGRAFVRRATESGRCAFKRLVVYSRDEQKQEEMAREFSHPCLRFFIGDVRDQSRLEFAMRDIDEVIHAAALKIVPAAEYNPTECVATNIGGAENVVRASIRTSVKRVVALSTDKAVNPINLYGASKLAAEKIFIAANALSAGNTLFSVVRYGNVVDSRGSVIPLFRKMAVEGKSLPVTDDRMTRFIITLDRAIDLVKMAFRDMRGREVFVPRIPSARILDIAEAMSHSVTHNVGIRPGEKLHECLIAEEESRNAIELESYFVIVPNLSDHYLRRYSAANALPEGFRYASDTNNQWLTPSQIRAMI